MRLALTEHELGAVQLPPAVHAAYLLHGTATVNGAPLAPDTGLLVQGALAAEGQGRLLVFTLSRANAESLCEPEERAGMVLAHRLPRDATTPCVLRLDRVDFQPDAVTPKHGHHGVGIRRLLSGALLAEIGEQVTRIAPGQAWYENGAEPVVGRVLQPGTAFLRCMVLDADMVGKSSFRAWTPADAAAPRAVGYRIFIDEVVQLP